MQTRQLQITLTEYASAQELPAAARELLTAAREVRARAYAPYSRFQVGAAVRLANGALISAANTENAAYPMCLCAERAALAAAQAQYPGVAPVAIAVTVANAGKPIDRPASPCGACRQVLAEQEERYGQAVEVILQGDQGPVYRLESARDLLPLSFSSEWL